jgi:hypothetical protein
MKTNVILIGSGDEPSLLHSRIIETLEHSPEYLVVYINQDNVGEIKGLDYDHIIYDELVDLECIERGRGITIKSPNFNAGTVGHPDWHNDPTPLVQFDNGRGASAKETYGSFEVKHKKPFYHKGRW